MTRSGKMALSLALAALLISVDSRPILAQSRAIDKAEAERAEVVPRADPAEETVAEDSEPPVDPNDRTPLGVDIGAIVLISHQDKAEPGPEIGEDKTRIDPEIPAPEGLTAILEGYLGEPVSLGLLADLAKDVVMAWRDSDYPLVDIYFPEQNISEGKVQLVVREALLGEVRVEGAKHSRPEYLRKQIRIDPGGRVNQRVVEADLDWLNVNPIRQVNLIYDRGEADGTSDIVLQTTEINPLSLYTGFANTGLNFTGQNEFSAGINLANPFQTEQSIGYNFGSDIEFETLRAHSLFYQAFLPWRHELRIIGAYVTTDVPGEPTGDPDMPPLDIIGENIQGTVDYRIRLPRPDGLRALRHAFTFGGDFKSTNTDLLFGGDSAFDSLAVVFQFRTDYEATLPDDLGYTRLELSSVWSPGDVLPFNDDASFSMLRERSSADYWYGQAILERGFQLPGDFFLRLRGTGQVTDDRLISTEQLLGGGYLTVRGFDENLIRGDSGAILNAELISPQFSLLKSFAPQLEDRWNALAFYDGAYFKINDSEAGIPDPSLQSLGVGLECRIRENVFARAAYGWAIDSHGVLPFGDTDGKMHFGITVTY